MNVRMLYACYEHASHGLNHGSAFTIQPGPRFTSLTYLPRTWLEEMLDASRRHERLLHVLEHLVAHDHIEGGSKRPESLGSLSDRHQIGVKLALLEVRPGDIAWPPPFFQGRAGMVVKAPGVRGVAVRDERRVLLLPAQARRLRRHPTGLSFKVPAEAKATDDACARQLRASKQVVSEYIRAAQHTTNATGVR